MRTIDFRIKNHALKTVKSLVLQHMLLRILKFSQSKKQTKLRINSKINHSLHFIIV